MKKLIYFFLFISLKMFGQKIDVVVGTSENGTGIRSILKTTTPSNNFAALLALNNATNNLGYGVYGTHSGGGSGVYGGSTSGNGIYGYSSSGIGGYFNSGSGAALVTGAGLVGIGTTPANYILDINGRTRIRHNGSTAGLWFNKSDNTEGAFTGMFDNSIYGFFGMGAVANWRFAFDLVNTKMGIGTFSPKHPLTFSSSIGDKISFWGGEAAATDNHYGMGIQGSVLQLFVPTASENIVFGTGRSGSFTERMRINGGGNVGVGINNPTSTLAVARGTGVNGTAAFYGTTWTSHFNYFTEENTYIRGGKAASKVFINDLAGLGSIQIGESVTPAGYKMSIDGKVICTELEVLITPWPDYVFKPNYQLKPLQEIEDFISQNGHLPNIPKAEDIENKSLALGNMAKLQMEKIEELTLYLIEINKRLVKVENENMVLKAELKTNKSQN